MTHDQFLLRVAQNVAEEFVERSKAASVGETIYAMAQNDWYAIRRHYSHLKDDLLIMRAFARDVLEYEPTRNMVVHTTKRQKLAA